MIDNRTKYIVPEQSAETIRKQTERIIRKQAEPIITSARKKQLERLIKDADSRDTRFARKRSKKKRLQEEVSSLRNLLRIKEAESKGKSTFEEIPKYIKGMKSEFYRTREWRNLRWSFISRQNGKCQVCGRTHKQHGVTMHVDHIKPRSKYPELELDKNNLQLLCEECNLGKGSKQQF
mgnify:CR=1 FL=1